ncbi:MAG: ribosome maturation factor RimP [Candidatus Competibacteraceae bacterium]|nr:ribosome maturation factor RimP [Candidatus Competibacteraceae bacterium]MCB1808877.1 ribosome maturation factor RimP [Candidatus Competibacteraceae bacterium]MCB1811542.1 ribosome maturation factor RimP [Candidatus Competibacteraceae bacterium]
MASRTQALNELCKPVVEAMGYELVGVEFQASQADGLLRVYIDQPDGIRIEDCERVSHQLSGLLDVENPIAGHYTLEVSSPGLDRPLFEAADFMRFTGRKARIQLDAALDGRRKFTGVIKGVENFQVILEVDQNVIRLPVDLIGKARLVPEF